MANKGLRLIHHESPTFTVKFIGSVRLKWWELAWSMLKECSWNVSRYRRVERVETHGDET